jgi:hypothetical protein
MTMNTTAMMAGRTCCTKQAVLIPTAYERRRKDGKERSKTDTQGGDEESSARPDEENHSD